MLKKAQLAHSRNKKLSFSEYSSNWVWCWVCAGEFRSSVLSLSSLVLKHVNHQTHCLRVRVRMRVTCDMSLETDIDPVVGAVGTTLREAFSPHMCVRERACTHARAEVIIVCSRVHECPRVQSANSTIVVITITRRGSVTRSFFGTIYIWYNYYFV